MRSAGPRTAPPLVVFLASDAAAGVTGQAIGIGGDRLSLYSHPAEVAPSFATGGWTAEAIAARWDDGVRAAAAALRRRARRSWSCHEHRRRLAGRDRRARARRAQRGRGAGPRDRRDPGGGGAGTSAATRRSRPRRRSPTTTASASMAAVVFTVDDEAGMGRRRLGNDEVLAAAEANPDVLIPFASRRPAQGQARRARGARADRARRARLQVPPQHAGVLAQRPRVVSAVRGDRRGGADRAVPLRHDRDRRGHAGRRRRAAEVLQPDAGRRRRRRLPRARHHPRPPLVPVAGGGAGGRGAQAERLHRPVRLVAEVLPGDPRALHEHAAQGQDAVRLRLPADHARPLAGGLREARRSATRCGRSC